MYKRFSFWLVGFVCVGLCSVGVEGREMKNLTERTQLRPVGWKPDAKLWFEPGPYWVDEWEGGVQSGTLGETVDLKVWNSSARMRFAPGFIRFERTAGEVKEGALEKSASICVVNTAAKSDKSLEFAGAPATVEFGYDGCVMKGTLVKEESLRMWNGESKSFPAGSVVEFNGAGEVIRGVAPSGEATSLDGVYRGTFLLTCTADWLDAVWKAVPFNFIARGGTFTGGFDERPFSLQWRGNYGATGAISVGMLTGWIDFKDLPDPHEFGPAFSPREKLRWTVTGPITGTLGPPATGRIDAFTVEAPDHPQITCSGSWTAVKAVPPDLKPTVEGTVITLKASSSDKLDLIFVIDQTSSMSSVFEQVQKTAKQILSTISGAFPDFRVGIVAYRDWGDPEMFRDFAFSSDVGAIQSAIDGLKAADGGDVPEAVLEALLRALRMPWRDGVNKQIILMGDAGPHTPIPQGPDKGKTADDVVKLAFEVDPAVINTITTSIGGSVSKDAAAAFEDLAKRTKGMSVTADKAEEVPKRIMEMVTTIAPVATTPPVGVVGGAPPVLPAMGLSTPTILVVVLLGACLCLAVAILVLRRRGADAAGGGSAGTGLKVQAGLGITFADGRTMQFRITGARTTIGRGSENLLVLNDGEASGRHAEIAVSREGFLLRDVGSANGTTLNGQPVKESYISVGDEIGIGTTRLILTE